MEAIDKKYLDVLLLLENHPQEYDTEDVCSMLSGVTIYDLNYLLKKKYIRRFWYDINGKERPTISLESEGRNYLAEYRAQESSKQKEDRKWITATVISGIALFISIIAIIVTLIKP